MKKILPILLLLLCSACTTAPYSGATHPLPLADGVPDERMNDLVMYAISLADTPYRNGGEKQETGFDCSGFVRHVFHKSLNWALPRTSEEMSRAGEPQEDRLRPGDLVFFNTQQQPFSHVGIYVGDGRFVHAPKTGRAVTLANMREEYWQSRYDGARRIRLPE